MAKSCPDAFVFLRKVGKDNNFMQKGNHRITEWSGLESLGFLSSFLHVRAGINGWDTVLCLDSVFINSYLKYSLMSCDFQLIRWEMKVLLTLSKVF